MARQEGQSVNWENPPIERRSVSSARSRKASSISVPLQSPSWVNYNVEHPGVAEFDDTLASVLANVSIAAITYEEDHA